MTAEVETENIAKVTKIDMVEFFASYISPASIKRSKLSIHLRAQSKPQEPTPEERVVDATQPVFIKDVHAFKMGMQVSVGVKPVRNLEEFVEVA